VKITKKTKKHTLNNGFSPRNLKNFKSVTNILELNILHLNTKIKLRTQKHKL